MATAVREWINAHRQDILDLLATVVNMESPSEEKAAVDAVGRLFQDAYRDLGFTVRTLPQTKYGDHVVAESPVTTGPRVLLVGHMDTVYPIGTTRTRPFTLRGGGAEVTGPAVMDMKGGLVAMVSALRALRAAGVMGAARVFLNADEEPGSPTSRDLWPEYCKDVDWAFILEPAQADGSLVMRRKGVGIFRWKVLGRAAHAGAEPEKGANAIQEMARKTIALGEVAKPEAGTTVNVGVIHGGTLPYVVPAEVDAAVDVRITSPEEGQRVLQAFARIAAEVHISGTRTTFEGFFHRPPLAEVPGVETLKRLAADVGREAGLEARFASDGGASDGNNIAAAGVPTLDGMGPAGWGAHSEQETMIVESLFQKTTLLALMLQRLWVAPRRLASKVG